MLINQEQRSTLSLSWNCNTISSIVIVVLIVVGFFTEVYEFLCDRERNKSRRQINLQHSLSYGPILVAVLDDVN